jgi:hypothetical protein
VNWNTLEKCFLSTHHPSFIARWWLFVRSRRFTWISQGLKETAVLHFANDEAANHASHPEKEKGLTFSYVCKGFQLATLTFFQSCQVCEFTGYQYTSHVPVVWSFMHPTRTHYIQQRSHLHISFC